ncbi:ABC transporter ATP-binding protein [Nostoc sp. C052]|uniref:ABC transporter ATP-binding protein n=1 Tax=Nostoc sp. C052 TaxID=2576902 RepID=UPI00277B4E14|nr:ABC transporter ATP-binding protein [Nostoc sp. C052]QLE42894.1 ABC transporter ATP-binding protein [Nostoc sp. C052]
MANMILMEGITKTYHLGELDVPVLKEIDLSIEDGEYVAIMGASGSGKSTLMNIIGCLDRPTSGQYILDGRDLTTLDDDELADIRNQYIGFVFQQFNLLPRLTALENVMLPMIYADVPRSQRLESAIAALEKIGLGDRLTNRPSQLSGGQQQRVAIARALVNHPALVLADEPTGALDSKTSHEIMNLLTELNQQGTTIAIVTHDATVAAQTKRVIQMQDGVIVERAMATPTKSMQL